MLEKMKVKLIGTKPLLLNAPNSINPLSDLAKAKKEISGKRKKSDADTLELHRLSFLGSLYYDNNIGVYIPSYNVLRSGQEGAKLSKQGRNWERGIDVIGEKSKLIYNGPKDKDDLWGDGLNSPFVDFRDVTVNRSKIIAARPIFREWALETTFSIASDVVNPSDILANLYTAGRLIGIGTYRQKFGRFEVELLESTVNLSKACNDLGIANLTGGK